MSRVHMSYGWVRLLLAVLGLAFLLGYPGVLLYTYHYGEPAVAHVEECTTRPRRCEGTWRFADGRTDSGRIKVADEYEGRDVEVVVGPLGPYVRDEMWTLWPWAIGPVSVVGGIGFAAIVIPIILRRARRMERELLARPLPPGGLLLQIRGKVVTRPNGSQYAIRQGNEIRESGGRLRCRLTRLRKEGAVQVTGPANEPLGTVRYDPSGESWRFDFRDATGAVLGWGILPKGLVTAYQITDLNGAKIGVWLASGLNRSVLRFEQPVPEPLATLSLVMAFEGPRLMRRLPS